MSRVEIATLATVIVAVVWACIVLSIMAVDSGAAVDQKTYSIDDVDVRVFPAAHQEKPYWIELRYGDGLTHYYRSQAFTAIVDPMPGTQMRTELMVGGKSFYLRKGITAAEVFREVRTAVPEDE